MQEIIFSIRSIMAKRGYKQKFVASKMNISERKLSDILNGRKIIDVSLILSFCEALDASPNEIFGYENCS